MMEQIVFAELPKTFRDAIIVSRRLGVRYIWIDSLCIIQKSTNDWQQEASLMNQVYTNGVCNISATAALDSSEGLFFVRDPATLRQLCFQACIDGIEGYFRPCDEKLWKKSVTDAPLNGRAWVCQERILAKRNLHFARGQVFWECCELLACESFPSGFSSQWDDMSLKQDVSKFFAACSAQRTSTDLALPPDDETVNLAYQVWGKIISLYSQGELTHETDKLTAIGGLAKLMDETLLDDYLAGLWKRNLVAQLLWYSCDGSTDAKEPGPYIAPSWSWAAVNGSIVNSYVAPKEGSTTLAEVMDAYTNTVSGDKYGQVTRGCITLRGKLARLKMLKSPGVLASLESPSKIIEGANPSLGEKGSVGVNRTNPFGRPLQFRWDDKHCCLHECLYLLPLYLQNSESSAPSSDWLSGLILMSSGEGQVNLVERCGVFEAWDQETIHDVMEGCKYFMSGAKTDGFNPVDDGTGGKICWISIV